MPYDNKNGRARTITRSRDDLRSYGFTGVIPKWEVVCMHNKATHRIDMGFPLHLPTWTLPRAETHGRIR